MKTRERPCLACGHIHDPQSPGKCWEAACTADCPEEHDGGSPYPYSPALSSPSNTPRACTT